jgi:hypothetical protein
MGHAAQLSALIRTPYERSIPASPNPRKAALTGGIPEHSAVPSSNLNDVTNRIIRDEVHRDTSEAVEVKQQALPGR